MTIENLSKKTEYEYNINYTISEQIEKEVEIELAIPLKKAINYVSVSLEDKKLKKYVYDIMIENQELVEMVNDISNIEVV